MVSDMSNKPSVDQYLFERGLKFEDYYIVKTPVSEEICYVGPGEREYVLHIGDHDLASGALARLKELSAPIIEK
jgi:hypothetical protein